MKEGREMVAEIGQGYRMYGGEVHTLTLLDRKEGSSSRGIKRGMLVADSVPELLESAKALYEQEGSWEAVAAKMDEAKEAKVG